MVGFRSAGFQRVLGHRTVLRVEYVEARPWSYRTEHGVLGLDTTAMSLVARTMGCAVEYRPKSSSQLADGLLKDEYDPAIGGLLDLRHPDIVSVTVPHATIVASVDNLRSRCRRAFFANVWWMRRSDFPLRYRVAFALFRWRLGFGKPCVAVPEDRRSPRLQRVEEAFRFRLRRRRRRNGSLSV